MKKHAIPPLLQKLAALAFLGVGLGLGLAVIIMPLVEAMAARDEHKQKLARFEVMLDQPSGAGPIYDLDELAAAHVDDAEALIALQAVIDRVARGAGVAVQSVRPLSAEQMSDIGRAVWIGIEVSSDLQGLTDLLTDINTERPVLLVRKLEVQRGEGLRPDVFLRLRLEAGRLWRAAETAS